MELNFCPKCGARLESTDLNFCVTCGFQLTLYKNKTNSDRRSDEDRQQEISDSFIKNSDLSSTTKTFGDSVRGDKSQLTNNVSNIDNSTKITADSLRYRGDSHDTNIGTQQNIKSMTQFKGPTTVNIGEKRSSKQRAQEIVSKARVLAQKGNISHAKQLINDGIRLNPEHAELIFYQNLAFLNGESFRRLSIQDGKKFEQMCYNLYKAGPCNSAGLLLYICFRLDFYSAKSMKQPDPHLDELSEALNSIGIRDSDISIIMSNVKISEKTKSRLGFY